MSRYIAVDSILARWYRTSVRGRTEFDQVIANIPSIDLEADYVPKEFHDKTCEAMAKRHQEEIADILERADADRPQGEWIAVDSYSAFGGSEEQWYAHGNPTAYHYCSVCKEQVHLDEFGEEMLTNFCPNCGARMKGADDE